MAPTIIHQSGPVRHSAATRTGRADPTVPLATWRNAPLQTTLLLASLAFFCGLSARPTPAQVVAVTLSLDKTQISVGESATLRAFAQIVPAHRPGTDRIFSWYVDLLNSNGAAAAWDPAALRKATSDNHPQTSSAGRPDGAHQRGIFDTFMETAGAGRDTPVELFSVPVRGLAQGNATFSLVAGSGAAGLSADFIAAPAGGGDPLLGGIYSEASVSLQVGGSATGPLLAIVVTPQGPNRLVTLSFTLTPGLNHFVEFRDSLGIGGWQTLPGGPHNSGSVADPGAPVGQRYYRLRVEN